MTQELTDIRAAMAELNRTMGRIESTAVATNQMIERIERQFDNHDKRLRKVENRQHWYAGAGSMIGIAIGYFVKGHAT